MRTRLAAMAFFILLTISGCTSIQYNEYIEKGKEALEGKNYEEAVTYFEKAVNEKTDIEAQQLLDEAKSLLDLQNYFETGSHALEEKKFDEAITIFTEIIQKHENKTDSVHIVNDAKASLKEASEQKEKSILEVAHIALMGKEYTNAIKYYSEIVELNDNNEEAKKLLKYSENMNFGSEALKNEQYDEAISLFTVALNHKPEDEEAIILKEEALNRKKELENSLTASTIPNGEDYFGEVTYDTAEQNNEYVVEPDYATVDFVNTMNYLMNYYNQNVLNQISGATKGMTSYGYLQVTLGSIYRESVNVYVPYPEYQPILDNWLKCLEATNNLLEVFIELSNGNISALNNDVINEVYHYYELTENGLYTIQ